MTKANSQNDKLKVFRLGIQLRFFSLFVIINPERIHRNNQNNYTVSSSQSLKR
jgi:hypothetical protein